MLTALEIETVAAIGRSVPPESVSVPLPSALALPRANVPADRVVPPL